MSANDLAQLELLAEIDALVEQLQRWSAESPDWPPAAACRALLRRVIERAAAVRLRIEAPLIVATLGGTGTGKSTLINALLGTTVVATGRQRPTTLRPTLLCRPGITAEQLGIEPGRVDVVPCDAPALRDLVLIDCPDPDTTEDGDGPAASNLDRLRGILPHCDVLLVTGTQEKYRSARVADELAAAAEGARLVFVQTHAAVDDDIRDDWAQVLGREYVAGRIFRVDSLAALADAQAGRQPRGEFAELLDLLRRQLAAAAHVRIRRANLLELAAAALERCRQRIDAELPAVAETRQAIAQERAKLTARLARDVRGELLGSRRSWEARLLDQTAARWGFSPFALVLRAYQGLGSLLSGLWLWRARTPAQLALWGAAVGVNRWRTRQQRRTADEAAARAVGGCWDATELRASCLVLEGYAGQAGLPRKAAALETVAAEAERAGTDFVRQAGGEIESLIARLAARHTGWFTRLVYEVLFLVMLGGLLFRLGKNFFYDSWLAPQPGPIFGLEFYFAAGFWLLLWCMLLLWALTLRLRRGLRRELDRLAESWSGSPAAAGLFGGLESHCARAVGYREELGGLEQRVRRLRDQLAQSGEGLGHRR